MGEHMRWADGFIAVDWGTTNRRAYKIDASGSCVDEFEDGQGALSVPKGEFPAAAAEIRQRLGDLPLLMAGMAGSNRGWVDAPYVPCPAGVDELVKIFAHGHNCLHHTHSDCASPVADQGARLPPRQDHPSPLKSKLGQH